MVKPDPARIVLTFIGLFMFSAAITLNTLCDFGAKSGIFLQSTEDVILQYSTPLTPAEWALFVWDFTYFWTFAMYLYFLVGLSRRTEALKWSPPLCNHFSFYILLIALTLSVYDWMYTTPAVLPYGFHVSLILKFCLNITWLFLFDRELLLPMLLTSALMMLANYFVLFFACHGLKIYGAWLNKYHKADLWLFRILVQNGAAVYATWGTLAALLNLNIYLQFQTGATRCNCAIFSLVLLLMALLVWFLLENFYFDEHVRYVMTIYPVIILWLSGLLSNSSSRDSYIYIFAAVILVISCIIFVTRIVLVTWKHHKQPLYGDSGLSMSPVEIALMHSKVFL